MANERGARARPVGLTGGKLHGDDPVAPGDHVILFGPGDNGEPTAEDWAQAAGTIPYEIVTGIGPRAHRVHAGRAPSTLPARRTGRA